MIAVAVSMANGRLYCLVAHGAAPAPGLGDPILADRITLDHRRAGLDERRTAILDCTPGDLERLKGYGLTDEEVWDVMETSCLVQTLGRRCALPWSGMAPAGGTDADSRTVASLTE